jgi:hypothetical protein
VASNPGQIPAGGKDKISIVVNTDNRGGNLLRKHFTVFTNDPRAFSKNLVVFGKVKGYVNVTPTFVRLMGKPGDDIRATIQITAEKEYPFVVKGIKAKEGQHIELDLKPLDQEAVSKGYLLAVRNLRKEPGVYRDFITITTDLKEKPVINIPVSGRIYGQGGTVRSPSKQ